MVAAQPRPGFVPVSFLFGASCQLPAAGTAGPRSAAEQSALTAAERRVCELMLRGLSNKEIASALGRAEATIKNQVAAVLRKHGVPSRARLLARLR
jgi:DNA-binding NarL/FixJ family response regulator